MFIPVDSTSVQALLGQIRGAVSSIRDQSNGIQSTQNTGTGLDFASVLRQQLDETSRLQVDAKKLAAQYTLGDGSVNLSDVMMAYQKSMISTQATVQMRNKLVTAYHDIMQMQI